MPLIEQDFSTDKERHPLPVIPTIPLPVIPAVPLPVIPAVFSGNPVKTILIPRSIRESYRLQQGEHDLRVVRAIMSDAQ